MIHKIILSAAATILPLAAYSQAKWITPHDNSNEPNTWLCFQKSLYLDALPDSMPARIAADSKYWLTVNGRPVVIEGGVKRGPTPSDTYFDTVDLRPYLTAGDNLVSVLVWHFGKDGFSHKSSGQGALLFDAPGLQSDGTWKALRHPAFYTPAGEEPNFRLPESNIGFDARLDMAGWQDDQQTAWPFATVAGNEGDAPWGNLYDRVIPQWRDFGLTSYVSTETRHGAEADTIVCRLPYNCHVMPYLDVTAPDGATIDIRADHYYGGSVPNVRAEYVTRSGNQQYEHPGWMNGEHIIYTIPKGVTVNALKYRETGYDTDFAGSFSCNDEFFNELWDKALRTLYVTMRDTYMDCPDRERAQWWGDEVNESGEAFYALSPSSHKLMKKGMYELINWQRPDGSIFAPVPAGNWDKELPGQMLASVGYYGFWNYYLNTGDIQPIADLYDGVKRYLAIWDKAPDGTIASRAGGWHWGDWGENIDKTALYNGWYYLALKGMRNMAEALGKTSEADSIANEMTQLKKAFNRSFWTGSAYRTPGYKDKTDDRVQALAVVGGLADPDKYDALLELFRTTEEASPYMEKYVIEALILMGQSEFALDRTKRRFMKMVSDPDHSTLFEGWGIGPDGFGGGTANHAWSGGALTLLSQYICGVSPVEPGYKVWRLAPIPAGLTHAEAEVPTVKGLIRTSFTDTPATFNLKVDVPAGTEAIVELPYQPSDRTVSVNGFANRHDAGRRLRLSEGSYSIKLQK